MALQFRSSPSRDCWDQDVFLSFRGKDTRRTFTDHLYIALDRVGIRTFRDNEELPRGKTISDGLVNAIRRSRIYVVVFSKDYASSTWCLDELAEIVDCCRKNKDHTLYPIFYHVSPSDVRNQTGTFGEAFTKHEKLFQTDMERETVQRWREALTEAGEYAGRDPRNDADGYEASFIKKIVDEILRKLTPANLVVAKHLIGIEFPVENVKALLNLGKSDVRIVGIYGIRGIGKTEIAKTVYNQIYYEFEGSSCLLDIEVITEKFNGLVQLQEQLLHDILKKDISIGHSAQGISMIKERLHRKKVLVVLDDLDHLEKLDNLLGDLRCFGLGSRFVITTTDERLLTQVGVDDRYKVGSLNKSHSLELFCRHAFDLSRPILGYEKLSINAVEYTGGLALALKVLGSFLRGMTNAEWKCELEKLQKKPHDKIQQVLKRSFDSLDDFTKDMFLDIACFFVGMDKEYAIKIFEGCGFFPNSGITFLEQRSLMISDHENQLRMHSLIQQMGRQIIHERALDLPKKYSRLWSQEISLSVLRKHVGTEVVEGLKLNLPVPEDAPLKTKSFENMTNLRLLQMDVVHLTGSFEYLPKVLRWLYWSRCPLKCLPQDFHLEKLVVLDMQRSKAVKIWKGYKMLGNLKILNLSYSEDLIKSPNLSGAPHLEKLMLTGCTRLVELHESIGSLKRLVLLSLRGCVSLRNLPSSIWNLESLKNLDMSYCLRLDKLPKQMWNLMASTESNPNGAIIKQQPFSFDLVEELDIELFGCRREYPNSCSSCFSFWISPKTSIPLSLLPSSVSGLRFLDELNLGYCALSEDEFPIDLGNLFSLRILKLSGNNFCDLPQSISSLPNLFDLEIDNCRALQSISGLPASLSLLDARGCTSLKALPNLSDMEHSIVLSLSKCHNLVDREKLQSLRSRITLMAALLSPVFFQRKSSKSVVRFHTIFQQSVGIPKWFGLQAAGSSISFHVPSLLEGKVGGLLVCASYHETSYAPIATLTYGPLLIVSVHNKSRGVYKVLFTDARRRLFFAARCVVHKIPVITKLVGGHKRYVVPEISYIPPRLLRSCYVHCPKEIGNEMEIGTGDEVEVAVEFHPDIKVYKCGIHLLVDETNVTHGHEFDMVSEGYAPPDGNISECIATTSHNITRGDAATEDGVFEDDVAAVDEVA